MNVTRMILAGALGFGLMSPAVMQCDSTKKWLGLFATATGAALSYVFFSKAAQQRKLLNDHEELATKFKAIKTNIDGLSTRLAQQSQSNGGNVKMKQECDAMRAAISEAHAFHFSYICTNPTVNIAFTPFVQVANATLVDDACKKQEEASAANSPNARRVNADAAYGLFNGWLKQVKEEAGNVNTALEKRAETLKSRRIMLSRLGAACAGFGIACAAALIKLYYWPTARA